MLGEKVYICTQERPMCRVLLRKQSDATTFNDLIILAVCADLPRKRDNYEIYHDNVKLEFDLKSWLDGIVRD